MLQQLKLGHRAIELSFSNGLQSSHCTHYTTKLQDEWNTTKGIAIKKNDVMSLKITSFFDVSTIVVNVTFLNNLVDETKVQNSVLKYPLMFFVFVLYWRIGHVF